MKLQKFQSNHHKNPDRMGNTEREKIRITTENHILEGHFYRSGKTRRRVLPHISTIHGRNGDMGHTENKDKRETTNSKRSQQHKIWRNKGHTGNNNKKTYNPNSRLLPYLKLQKSQTQQKLNRN